MIALAKADDTMHEREYEFILAVGIRLGVQKQEGGHLFENPLAPVVAKQNCNVSLNFTVYYYS
jgi:hypothetical protein